MANFCRLSTFAIIVSTFLTCFASLAHATEKGARCASAASPEVNVEPAPKAENLLRDLQGLPPRFKKLLEAGLLERYWDDPLIVELSKKLAGLELKKTSTGDDWPSNTISGWDQWDSSASGNNRNDLNWGTSLPDREVPPAEGGTNAEITFNDWAWGSISTAMTYKNPPTADLGFESAEVSGSITKAAKGVWVNYTIGEVKLSELNIGDLPAKIDMDFSKVVVAILRAIEIDRQKNPKISKVEIGAGSVVNPGLYKLLPELGFKRVDLEPIEKVVHVVEEQPLLAGLDIPAPYVEPVQLELPLPIPWGDLHPDYAKNWALSVTLKKPSSK